MAVIAVIGMMLGGILAVMPESGAYEAWLYRVEDAKGDAKLGHPQTGYQSLPVMMDSADLLALEANADAGNLYWRITAVDLPSATEVSTQKDSFAMRYLVRFCVFGSPYSATLDIQYVAGEKADAKKGEWGPDNGENAPNPLSEWVIDPAANTIVFTIKRADIGNPQDGAVISSIQCTTWFGALYGGTVPGFPWAAFTVADCIPGEDVAQYSVAGPYCPDYTLGAGSVSIGGVSLTCASNKKDAHAGGIVTYDIIVKNEGSADETVSLSVAGAPDKWAATLDKQQATVAADSSDTVALTVKAPSDAKEGDKANITVTGAYSGGGVASVCTVTAVVGAGTRIYGAEITVSPTSGEADKGKQATYTVTVKNTGSAQDTITLEVVSEKGWEVSLGKESISLAAGASGTATLTVKVPSDATEGDKDTAMITATCGDGTTNVPKAVQTTVKAGAGSSGDGAKKGFIPGFEMLALIGGLGIVAIIAKSGNKKRL